jgi:hypothetical protein
MSSSGYYPSDKGARDLNKGLEEGESAAATEPGAAGGSRMDDDATARGGDEPGAELTEVQTSHKTGSHSIVTKEQEARYTDRSMPQTRKVAGAFGEEPQDALDPAEGE